MAEYIERDAALEECDWYANEFCECEYAIMPLKGALEILPAADVRPVVKARWVYTDMSRLVCSNCGNPVAFALKDDGWHHGDYCPNCGARMEES